MFSTRKLLTVTLAAATLAIGSMALSGEASAGFKGGHGFHKGHFHKWHGHRWGHRFFKSYGFYDSSPCYWVKKRHGAFKVCPSYYY